MRPETKEMIKSVLVLIVIFFMLTILTACAGKFEGKCYVQPLGINQAEGVMFVNVACEENEK